MPVCPINVGNVHSYIGRGGSAHLTSADFTCCEGVQQGAVEASFLFYIGTNKANQTKYRDLLQTGGGLIAGIDVIYLLGQPDVIITTLPIRRAQLNKVGLVFNDTKTE
eukprot:15366397-Ditylum_brightwellii.AAC.1